MHLPVGRFFSQAFWGLGLGFRPEGSDHTLGFRRTLGFSIGFCRGFRVLQGTPWGIARRSEVLLFVIVIRAQSNAAGRTREMLRHSDIHTADWLCPVVESGAHASDTERTHCRLLLPG